MALETDLEGCEVRELDQQILVLRAGRCQRLAGVFFGLSDMSNSDVGSLGFPGESQKVSSLML